MTKEEKIDIAYSSFESVDYTAYAGYKSIRETAYAEYKESATQLMQGIKEYATQLMQGIKVSAKRLMQGIKVSAKRLMQNSSVSSKQQKTIKECEMTAYENLKSKEEILREASRRAESPETKLMWLMKSRELRCKIDQMTVEEAEKEVLTAKEPSQMNKNKRGFLTTFAKRALYNLFCLVVVLAVLLCLPCDWGEVFYPIG